MNLFFGFFLVVAAAQSCFDTDMASKNVLVYGAKGALGSTVLAHFKQHGYRVIAVDLVANEQGDSNIILNASDSWSDQASQVKSQLQSILGEDKLAGVYCVAGGWAGGNAASDDVVEKTDLMIKQSVWPSIICANVASAFLQANGLLVLTGAVAALSATPEMIAYGVAKGAVHQLVKSLAAPKSGLPEGAKAVAILPITLDTPMNRKFMPSADTSTWTPLEFVATLLYGWTTGAQHVDNGSLVQLITKANETHLHIA